MPRSGGGIYSKPAGTTAVAGTLIESAKFNTVIDDIAADLNAPRPVASGGTGAANAADARTNLGAAASADTWTKVEADARFFQDLTRTEIASRTTSLRALRVLGDTLVGDAGAGALYQRSTTPGTRGIQDSGGAWFNLVTKPAPNAAGQWGVRADGRCVFDASVTAGGNVITSALAQFTAQDIGKVFVLPESGATDFFSLRRAAAGTILSVAGNTATVSFRNGLTSFPATLANRELIFGSDDSAAINFAVLAADAAKVGGLQLPHGIIMLANPVDVPTGGFHISGVGGRVDVQPANYQGTETTGLASQLFRLSGRMVWAGAFGQPMALLRDSNIFGFWVKHAGSGLSRVVMDCASATCTAVALRGQTMPFFQSVFAVRFMRNQPVSGAVYGTTVYEGAWDLSTSTQNLTVYPFQDVSNGQFYDCWAINRGSLCAGAVGWWTWADKGFGSNINYLRFYGGGTVLEQGGGVVAANFEQADTFEFYGHVWGGRYVLHSADSGTRSTWQGVVEGVMRSSQCRSFTFYGGGLIEAKGHSDPDLAARMHRVDYQVENIWTPPIIGANADLVVITSCQPDGTGRNGQARWGGVAPAIRCDLATNQSIPNAIQTAINWRVKPSAAKVVTNDYLGLFSPGQPSRVPVPANAKQVNVYVSVAWAVNGVGVRTIRLHKNGNLVDYTTVAPTSEAIAKWVAEGVPVATGDYFEIVVVQDSGAALDVTAGVATYCHVVPY